MRATTSITTVPRIGEPVEYHVLMDELDAETRCVQRLHRLLAAELEFAAGRTGMAIGVRPGAELSAKWERDVAVHRWSERVGQLRAARWGLCFGRLDPESSAPLYIGRIGLADPDGGTALVDWRAPAARPFYCATLATPLGMARRRHFVLAGRAPEERVTDVHDDVFVVDSGN